MTGQADLYRFKARLLPWSTRGLESLGNTGTSWHDGDTFNALVSRGGRDYWMVHVRTAGFNAPELRTSAGPAALTFAQSLVDTGGIVYLDSLAFITMDEQDDFGRMLALVTLPDGRDLASVMISSGHGVPA
jgi:endonuclease YncB( thermonuclease family)